MASITALLAAPSTGGTVTRTTSASPLIPETESRQARGITRMASTAPHLESITRIGYNTTNATQVIEIEEVTI